MIPNNDLQQYNTPERIKKRSSKSLFISYLQSHAKFQNTPEGRFIFSIIALAINDLLNPSGRYKRNAKTYLKNCPHWEMLDGDTDWLWEQIDKYSENNK